MMLPVLVALLYAFVRLQREPVRRYDQAASWRDAVRTDAARRSAMERITMPGAAWDRYAISIDPGSGSLTIRPKWQYRIVPTAQRAAAPLTTRLTKILPKSRRARLLLLVAAASALAFATYWTLGLPLTFPLSGVTRTWDNGGADGVWSNATNWSDNTKPAATDDVVLDATSTANCTMDEDSASLGTVTVAAAYIGTFSINTRTLIFTSITCAGIVTVSTGVMSGSLTATYNSGASVTYSGAGTYLLTQEMAVNAGATFTCSGQAVSISIASARTAGAYGLAVVGAAAVCNLGTSSVTVGSIQTGTSGALTATSGTMTVNGRQSGGSTFSLTGGFTHNSGTVSITQTIGAALIEFYTSSPTFNNLTINSTAVEQGLYTSTASLTVTVAGNLVLTAGTFSKYATSPQVPALVITGTNSITGTLTLVDMATTFTGTVTINSGGTIGKTSGTGAVNTNDNWTVAAGGTLSLTGAGQVFNQNTVVKQVTVSGTLTVTGAVGNHIAWLTSYALLIGASTVINLQYVTFTNNGTSDYNLQFGGAPTTVTNLDNLILNKKSGANACMYAGTTSTLLTFTNCTFAGVEGAEYYQKHILVAVDRNVRLSSCIYTNVGFAGTNASGWVSSITDQGVANAHVFYGILSASTPASAYQIADADNVTLKTSVGEVAFTPVLTLDQAETVATLTTSASTTAKLNGNITLTFTTLTNNGAFEFAANTVNAAALSGGTIGGTAPDMDSGGAGSKVTLTGVTITPAITTGGAGVTITYTGTCVQSAVMTHSAGDILVLSSGAVLKHAGFSRASAGRVQIARTADFYNTGDLLSDPLPRVLPLAIPPTGYNQMLWEAV